MVVPRKAGRGSRGNKHILFGGADNLHFLLGCSQVYSLEKWIRDILNLGIPDMEMSPGFKK